MGEKRIEQEIKEIGEEEIGEGTRPYKLLATGKDEEGYTVLKLRLTGEKKTIYDGESWVIQLTLKNYPFEAPTTTFVGTPPQHPHIYSIGHICLSLLYEDWIPSLSISMVLCEISRMLGMAKVKSTPPDDFQYCNSHQYGSDPKLTKFSFHSII